MNFMHQKLKQLSDCFRQTDVTVIEIMINFIISIYNMSCCDVMILENILEQIFNDLNENVNLNINICIVTACQIWIVRNNSTIINLNFSAVFIYSYTSNSDRTVLRLIIDWISAVLKKNSNIYKLLWKLLFALSQTVIIIQN